MTPPRRLSLTVDAVIFDMDGVITNTMPDHYRAWKRVLSGEGIAVSRRDVYLKEGQKGVSFLEELFPALGRPYRPRQARALLARKERLFKQIVRPRLIPGAVGLLRDLARRQFRLALVTGTSRHEMRRILPADIGGLFEVLVTGSDVAVGKPDPAPFRTALAKLALPPASAVVIENAPFGVQSAVAAGLRCIGLETSLSGEHLRGTIAVYPSIAEMRRNVHFYRNGADGND